ncbi:MAG: hypothetical protein ACR2J8_13685, partial [Thermomicrobiales bacterium]
MASVAAGRMLYRNPQAGGTARVDSDRQLVTALDSLLDRPLRNVTCSYPVPGEWDGDRWVGEPAWDAAIMEDAPLPRLDNVRCFPAWTYDFRRFFGTMFVVPWHPPAPQMRFRQLILRGTATRSGTLVVWADDRVVVRRNGAFAGERRDGAGTISLDVRAGDDLEFACAQVAGEWWLAMGFERPALNDRDRIDLLQPYIQLARERMRTPDGPPLKVYTDFKSPSLAASSVLTTIVNGYAPDGLLFYGDYQWDDYKRGMLGELLPFARVVPTDGLLDRLRELGGPALPETALRHWMVMKTCIALLEDPGEAAIQDDDLLTLDPMTDALDAFRTHDLVHIEDREDWAEKYRGIWSHAMPLADPMPNGLMNAGLMFVRQSYDRRDLARIMAEFTPEHAQSLVDYDIGQWCWEQGLIAALYAERPVFRLDPQRYLYAPHDGVAGGALAYDYERNPARYTSVHFVVGGYDDHAEVLSFAMAQRALRRSLPLVEALPEAAANQPEVEPEETVESLHERAIASYGQGRMDEGQRACDLLLGRLDTPAWLIENTRRNAVHYAPNLAQALVGYEERAIESPLPGAAPIAAHALLDDAGRLTLLAIGEGENPDIALAPIDRDGVLNGPRQPVWAPGESGEIGPLTDARLLRIGSHLMISGARERSSGPDAPRQPRRVLHDITEGPGGAAELGCARWLTGG